MGPMDLVFLVWEQTINNMNSQLTVKLIAEAPCLANQVAGLLANCWAKHLIPFSEEFLSFVNHIEQFFGLYFLFHLQLCS